MTSTVLPPVDAPEIWCAGVTYERSRDARLEEAQTDARDVYALVYDADRPELFMKDASMRRTVGPDHRDARFCHGSACGIAAVGVKNVAGIEVRRFRREKQQRSR